MPAETGFPYDQAAAQLGSLGFRVTKAEVESDQPAGTVLAETPPPNSSASKGSAITLSVSKGPTSASVPDVTSQDPDTATATLETNGFTVQRTQQDVTDPNLDNTVVSQDPPGG